MHDGVKAYEGVLETVSELKAAGKKLIILSNSSKRRDNSEKMLKKRECLCIMKMEIYLICLRLTKPSPHHLTFFDS